MGSPWGAIGIGALYLPGLIPLFVAQIERLKGPGNGQEKKAAVKELVASTLAATAVIAGKPALASPQLEAAIDVAIDAAVAVANSANAAQKVVVASKP